ncbi:hypothetical protein [Nostoc commune]|uniref:hypothetical protein n=1 Tax=Nostoc commune TaxID=1178 RepID=UPI0018C6576B|nr:hypothetical protein [Nostoc commune]MBG1258689.1 DUF4158 domain-containing protein [Nostoc commune BAE]MBG1259379.1 DUF4158 domain-containing protein [Nostoc commune BAE]
MNLPLEVMWSLILTSLIGLWLIWQAIKINSNIDIFDIAINWFRDRPIILPSLLFLISPFFFTFFKSLLNFYNADMNNAILDKFFEEILVILATITSFLIGNRFLEGFKKSQEEKKVAKMIIASIEGHLEYLKKIKRDLELGTLLSKSEMESIESTINQITKNYIYESALKSVGVFTIKHIDVISRYSRRLNTLLDNILNSYEKSFKLTVEDEKTNRYIPLSTLQILRKNIEELTYDAKSCIRKLSTEILHENDKFNKY